MENKITLDERTRNEALQTLTDIQKRALVQDILLDAENNAEVLRVPELSQEERAHHCGYYDGVKSTAERLLKKFLTPH